MEAALIILLLALAGGNTTSEEPTQPTPSAGGPAPSGGGSDGGGTLKTILGVAGSIGTLATTIAGAVGGGAAATTTVATTTVTGAAGATGGGSVSGASGGAAGAGAAAGIVGDVAVGVSAGGAGATSVIVGIVIAFIVAERVVHAQENDKDWQGYALGLNPNALALNNFEVDVVRKILAKKGLTWSERAVRDFRLDRNFPGLKLRSRGYRTIIDSSMPVGFKLSREPSSPVMPDVQTMRTVRALTMEFLRLRAQYGYRLIKAWNIVTPPADWGFTTDLLKSVYEASVPGVGNLADVPSALGGRTLSPRSDPQQELPPASELVGDGVNNGWDTSLLTPELRKVANLAAIVDACAILKWDPRPGFDLDPAFYARAVCDALQWGGNTVDGLEVRGEWLWLNPALFPVPADSLSQSGIPSTPGTPAFMIRPATIRLGKNGCVIA